MIALLLNVIRYFIKQVNDIGSTDITSIIISDVTCQFSVKSLKIKRTQELRKLPYKKGQFVKTDRNFILVFLCNQFQELLIRSLVH